jgi:hypothetical protein
MFTKHCRAPISMLCRRRRGYLVLVEFIVDRKGELYYIIIIIIIIIIINLKLREGFHPVAVALKRHTNKTYYIQNTDNTHQIHKTTKTQNIHIKYKFRHRHISSKICRYLLYCDKWRCLWAEPGCRMTSYGMLRRLALVRTDVSEELSATFIRVTRIGEIWTTLAVCQAYLRSVCRLLVTARVIPSSPESCHPDEGGAKFLRNDDCYKSHTAPNRHHFQKPFPVSYHISVFPKSLFSYECPYICNIKVSLLH